MDVRVGDMVGVQLGENATIISSEPNGSRASACADALAHQGCLAKIEGADMASKSFAFNRASVRDRGVVTQDGPVVSQTLKSTRAMTA